MLFKAVKDETLCQKCGWCEKLIPCPVGFKEFDCIGCGACTLACPYEALTMSKAEKEREIEIEIDGNKFDVPKNIPVKRALEEAGHLYSEKPEGGLYAPCGVGGCGSCGLEIDGEVKPACVTPVTEGLKINTAGTKDFVPKRIVGGFMGHAVGGVGTPWNLKNHGCVEAAVFTAGCNFRCPQCQNWTTAYLGKEGFDHQALTPRETAEKMTRARKKYGVDRMAVSGGESTLNRKWLIEFLRELKKMNPDEKAGFHVDTNGSLLTEDYIDELVEAGMTDIGIDLKGLETETFLRITGLTDEKMAKNYKQAAWQAVHYIAENYRDTLFLGVGIPYNRDLIALEEIEAMGEEIVKTGGEIQVCPLDYRPEFRRRDLSRPAFSEMKDVYRILKGTGLKTVICQTAFGYIGP